MKTESKIFLLIFIWSVIFQINSSYASLLNNGLPRHSLGYADEFGYVLYTDKLFDLNIVETKSDEESVTIPIRVVFYTASQTRKSLLLEAYWSFPIFDSYIAKSDKNLIYWQTPDLNIIKFRPSKEEDSWETYGGYKRLKIQRNGDYIIEWKNLDAYERLIYDSSGKIKKILFKRKSGTYSYIVSKTRNSILIRDKQMNVILSIDKQPSTEEGFKNTITLKSGENTFIWHTKDVRIYSNGISMELEMLAKSLHNNEESYYEYESDEKFSKMILKSGEVKKIFEWDSKTGLITRDWLGKYNIEKKNSKQIAVEHTIPWALLSFENFFGRGISYSGYNDFILKRSTIGGTHSLSGRTRKIEIFKKGERSAYKTFRYFYDKNGKESIKQ